MSKPSPQSKTTTRGGTMMQSEPDQLVVDFAPVVATRSNAVDASSETSPAEIKKMAKNWDKEDKRLKKQARGESEMMVRTNNEDAKINGTDTTITTTTTATRPGAVTMRAKLQHKQNKANNNNNNNMALADTSRVTHPGARASKERQPFPVEKFGGPQRPTIPVASTGAAVVSEVGARSAKERQSFPVEKFGGARRPPPPPTAAAAATPVASTRAGVDTDRTANPLPVEISTPEEPTSCETTRADNISQESGEQSDDGDIRLGQETPVPDDLEASLNTATTNNNTQQAAPLRREPSLIEAVLVTEESKKSLQEEDDTSQGEIQLAEVVPDQKQSCFTCGRGALLCVGLAILVAAGAVVGTIVMTSGGDSNSATGPVAETEKVPVSGGDSNPSPGPVLVPAPGPGPALEAIPTPLSHTWTIGASSSADFPIWELNLNGTHASCTNATEDYKRACELVMVVLTPVLPSSSRDKIDIPGTCQYSAKIWLYQNNTDIWTYPTHRVLQRYAMAVFFCEMDGPNWSRRGYWMDPVRHECDWQVGQNQVKEVCDSRSQQLRILQLNDRLVGTLPPELTMISSLWEVSIGESLVGGCIPPDFEKLSELESLQLPFNLLQCDIPDFVWSHRDMAHMDLLFNLFRGTIPPNLPLTAPGLRVLELSGNLFNGTLPPDLAELDWKILHLDSNSFEGPIPPTMFQGSTNFESFFIHKNNFSGEIPAGLGNLNKMLELTAHQNPNLYGDINEICRLFDRGVLRVAQVDTINVACACCGNGRNFRSAVSAASATHLTKGRSDDLPKFKEHSSSLFKFQRDSSAVSSTSYKFLATMEPTRAEEDMMPDIDFLGNITDFFGAFLGLIPDDDHTTPLDDFDRISDSCDMSELLQPHVVSQCECNGKIKIVAVDIRDMHTKLKDDFAAVVYKDFDGYYLPITSCDPRNQALVWLASGNNRRTGDLFQRYILATLYFHWEGGNWSNQSNWLSEEEECQWFGVHCNQKRIVGLKLDSLNIVGTIPPEIVFLRSLNTLSLSRNAMGGEIPAHVFSLLPDLRFLRLDVNGMTGSIPTEVGIASNLEVLRVGGNQLGGNLPSQLGMLTNLEFLGIEFDNFIRFLPSELGQLINLVSLDITNNRISGTLPSQIGGLVSLERWILVDVLMTGSVPSQIGLMSSLQELRMVDVGMHGPLPTEIGLLTELRHFDIRENHFSGKIISELGGMTNLEFLALLKNDLTGTIPSEAGQLTKLTRLDLYDIYLSGTLPSEIGQLSLLDVLTLDRNDLISTIAVEVCELLNMNMKHFVVDCPTDGGRGVGIYTSAMDQGLWSREEGNCFTFCRWSF